MTQLAPQHSLPDASKERAVATLGAILWPSFFAAGVATMVFFAIFDPADLSDLSWPQLLVSRELGYAIGFFMFWFCTMASSAFTALLLYRPKTPTVRTEFADLP